MIVFYNPGDILLFDYKNSNVKSNIQHHAGTAVFWCYSDALLDKMQFHLNTVNIDELVPPIKHFSYLFSSSHHLCWPQLYFPFSWMSKCARCHHWEIVQSWILYHCTRWLSWSWLGRRQGQSPRNLKCLDLMQEVVGQSFSLFGIEDLYHEPPAFSLPSDQLR